MFRIKICGITTPADARLAAEAGADAIGINFYARSRRFVEPRVAQKIAAAVPASVAKVGVFVNAKVEEIQELVASVPLDYVQLHGDEPPKIIQQLSPLPVIKAFRSQDSGLARVVRFLADCGEVERPIAVLIDAYHHVQYGGTGVALDWIEVGRQNDLLGETPLILAGGLTADNITKAIQLARPMGVDVASGVESSPGVKDSAAVQKFVTNAKAALGNRG